jgi:hypothetical protein
VNCRSLALGSILDVGLRFLYEEWFIAGNANCLFEQLILIMIVVTNSFIG